MKREAWIDLIFFCGVLATVAVLSGCSNPPDGDPARCRGAGAPAAGAIGAFASDGAFRSYLGCLADAMSAREDSGNDFGSPTSASASADTGADTSITNNQESAADEGDIVKHVGGYLVVLRKGWLHAVSVASIGSPVQTDAIRVAREPALDAGVWYDEVLVYGSRIFVLGLRYHASVDGGGYAGMLNGVAEINVFTLTNGKLARGESVFIESNDYYSGSNYASRLVGGKLVFYLPYHGLLYGGGRFQPYVPSYLTYSAGRFVRGQPLVDGASVFHAIENSGSPSLHTVLSCDPSGAQLSCRARSLLGPSGTELYVSADNAFLWLDRVYRISLSDLAIGAHAVRGMPRDQFSFKQLGGNLHVITSEQGSGVAYAGYGYGYSHGSSVHVLSLPLSGFDSLGTQALDSSKAQSLFPAGTSGYLQQNRFVGDKALVAMGLGSSTSLAVHDLATRATSEISLATSAARIEPLDGFGALVVGEGTGNAGTGYGLTLQAVALSAQPRVTGTVTMQGASQGEWRSHGFFFRADSVSGGGTLGLPIVNSGTNSAYWWGPGVSDVSFFSLGASGVLQPVGMISSAATSPGACETSCVDWYGNTRPIFLGERVFALMGSELQEAQRVGQQILSLGARLLLTR